MAALFKMASGNQEDIEPDEELMYNEFNLLNDSSSANNSRQAVVTREKTILERAKEFSEHESSFYRQLAINSLFEAFQIVAPDDDASQLLLFEILYKLCQDVDTQVRSEVARRMCQLTNICQMSNIPFLKDAIQEKIIPHLLQLAADVGASARKPAIESLLYLLETRCLGPDSIDQCFLPLIRQLTNQQDDGQENGGKLCDAATLLGHLVPFAPLSVVREHLLPIFLHLSESSNYNVRRLCAQNVISLSLVFRPISSQSALFLAYARLCADTTWDVRKACAVNFGAMAKNMTRSGRWYDLTPLFLPMLKDSNQVVREAAADMIPEFLFQFADARRTGLVMINGAVKFDESQIVPDAHGVVVDDGYSDNTPMALSPAGDHPGVLMPAEEVPVFNDFNFWCLPLTALPEFDFGSSITHPSSNTTEEVTVEVESVDLKAESVDLKMEPSGAVNVEPNETDNDTKTSQMMSALKIELDTEEEDEEKLCTPVQTEESGDAVEEAEDSFDSPSKFDSSDEEPQDFSQVDAIEEQDTPEDPVPPMIYGSELNFEPADAYNNADSGTGTESPGTSTPKAVGFKQDLIPHAVLGHLLRMHGNDSSHLAQAFTALAFVLGRKYWCHLKPLFENLAADNQWRVRRLLAFQIHHIGNIIGSDAAASDLKPIFDQFCTDVDEVRTGLVQHFYTFLQFLSTNERTEYLNQFSEFLQPFNAHNWRFRLDLTRQLILLAEFYTAEQLHKYFLPIAFDLLADQRWCIKKFACHLAAIILFRMSSEADTALRDSTVDQLVRKLAESHRSKNRKMFIMVCHNVAIVRAMVPSVYSRGLLGHVLKLNQDPVVNVRILIAYLFAQHLIPCQFFSSQDNPHYLLMRDAVNALKSDADPDVRYYISHAEGKLDEYVFPARL